MSIYNLKEYSDNFSKTSGSLWYYYRDETAINNNGIIIDFPDDTDSALLKFKQKITGQTGHDETKVVQIMIPLKILNNFKRIFEILLINCEIYLFLAWSAEYIIVTKILTNITGAKPIF